MAALQNCSELEIGNWQLAGIRRMDGGKETKVH
jgi:hypothetical protein